MTSTPIHSDERENLSALFDGELDGDAALKLDCGAGLGAATHITGVFAFAAVGRALEILLKGKAPAV